MSQTKILVVEDERIVAEDIRMCLEDAGYAVCGIAKRGDEAIALAIEHQPDLALLDIVLRGEKDGIDVANAIKEHGIPFIFLTAYSQQGVVERAKETEPMGYLIKPFEQASLLSAVDIAIHKARIDSQLIASHEWFYTTLHSIGDGVIAADPDGNVVFLNGVAEELTQWGSDAAIGKPITEIFPIVNEHSREMVTNPVVLALENHEVNGLPAETVLVRPDGSEIPVDDSGAPILDSEGKLVGAVLIFRDVTDAKKAAREASAYQEHLEDLVNERTQDLQRRIQLEGRLNEISMNLLDLSDDDLEEGISKALAQVGDFLGLSHCGIYERNEGKGVMIPMHVWSDAEEGAAIPIDEIWHSDWSQGLIDSYNSAKLGSLSELPVEFDGLRRCAASCGIEAFAVFPISRLPKVEGFLFMASREEYSWRDHESRLVETFVQIIRSGLQRLEAAAERRVLMEELNQSSKLEAIGKLTGGIAHDFNNMLLPIIGYSDMLLDRNRRDESEGQMNEVAEIRKAAESAAALTHQLLAFSRKQILEKEVMDLNVLVRDKASLLSRVLGEDIELEIDLCSEGAVIEADTGQMDQVMMNLCVNARDAMPSGGRISISTARSMWSRDGSGEPKPYLNLVIEDTGSGIPEEVKSRVFDPFFTTKGMDGTGLGLSVVVGIIDQHGGRIDLKTELGVGTRFSIHLPLSEVVLRSAECAVVPRERAQMGRSERILLIEDELSVVTFVQTALRKKGYEVFPAMSAKEAFRVFAEHDGAFDLIFSDAMLPDGTGMEVLDDLLTQRPDIKGLLSSGYTDHRALVDAARERDIAFLHKPYALSDLYATIDLVLDRDVVLAG